ncbi:N-acetylmuramoyl-L-alanine amidase [Flagellimonas meridianipacifica]|uniref:N-acetylmuramoyl-L-alanine amidase n=1 Tax=Flagellimonas meridianipacifica TaxID=1080225 RepID=A0A2T0MFS3_9FLAO|nr:N-acetylmuramoyl-L-alanine amidase [Allomuricauda pacifica]PRX56412.1 N-acetylmuramoyl-L-alanine amidase [Allomuricauda pacifica]
MKYKLALVLWVFLVCTLFAQEKAYKVVAEPGDGIYSILRKQGLDPVKHYQEFVELNQENIKDGSFLHVGREYYIPYAAESFKNVGVRVFLASDTEEPVFEKELRKLSRKSDALKDVVYYLITENGEKASSSFAKEVELNLAKTLLENGAHVFVLEQKGFEYSNKEQEGIELMGAYVEAVNKRYLKHFGKYQRLLIIRANGQIKGKIDVSVYHHKKSDEGKRLAKNLREVFQKNSVKNRSYKSIEAIINDDNTLYLAKNVLPAVSLLDIDGTSAQSKNKGIEVVSNKAILAQWLANGILKDYADLKIEE